MEQIPTFERNGDEEKFVSAAFSLQKPKKYWTGQEKENSITGLGNFLNFSFYLFSDSWKFRPH